MRKRKFYKIRKQGDNFIAKRDARIMFEGNIKSLKQRGVALIAEKENGKYDLYLPVQNIAYSCKYFDNSQMCLLTLTDIYDYRYFKGLLIICMENCCYFIEPKNFTLFLDHPGLLAEKINKLPFTSYTPKAQCYIDNIHSKENHYIVNIAGNRYSINTIQVPKFSSDPQLSINIL